MYFGGVTESFFSDRQTGFVDTALGYPMPGSALIALQWLLRSVLHTG
jgi:hypothetical protein